MSEQDREAFEKWFDDQPIHPSNTREHRLLRACWLAATAHANARTMELVDAVEKIIDSGLIMAGATSHIWEDIAELRTIAAEIKAELSEAKHQRSDSDE